jgi:general secretion pathway protein E
MNNPFPSFINLFVEKGLIQEKDIETVLSQGDSQSISLGDRLIESGLITEEQYISTLEEFYKIPFLREEDYPKEPILINTISFQFMKESKFIPIRLTDHEIIVAMENPFDFYVINAIRVATNKKVKAFFGRGSHILRALENHYGSGFTSVEKLIENIDNIPDYVPQEEENVDHLKDMASEGPVIRLVNLIISRAIEMRASDIHLEPLEDKLRVRYRIDGVLHDVESLPKRFQPAVLSRVKIMAKLNIAERRLPQDGRIMLRVKGKDIDFRVSSVPTIYGESLALRILDKSSIVLDIERLGFPEDELKEFKRLIESPHGIILVTGPTGSGKTTTLYCALEKINTPGKKIITVEDPVEYQLKGVNQIQVKPQIGLSFANALRSIVRQDPDVILIGEIRDSETADIAIHSALTGHLVLSTLHTNDAPSAITRLIDMGMEDYLLTSTILCILAQRLVRVLCPHCKVPSKPDPILLEEIGIKEKEEVKVMEGKGCEHCSYTGYFGRTGIFELLIMDDEMRRFILSEKDASKIKEMARRKGMRTLREDGWLRVKGGVTSLSEVMRVTHEEERIS